MNSQSSNGQFKDTLLRLWQDGYVVVRHLLSENSIKRLSSYVLQRWESGAISTSDTQVPNTPALYGDPVMDKLLADLVPTVERISGRQVFPTYSYMRLYKTGDVLAKHTDRQACEISLSLCVAAVPSEGWPLWIESRLGIVGIELIPGDAVLYLGMDCAHWREKFAGTRALQVFLHYVDQNGPYQSWRFDKRACLAHMTAA